MRLILTDGSEMAVDNGAFNICGGENGATIDFMSNGEPVMLHGDQCSALFDGDGDCVVVFDEAPEDLEDEFL